ncbi:MAG: hypothetical protein ABIT01_09235, partial [Thermoanaerobaculia bacterium]
MFVLLYQLSTNPPLNLNELRGRYGDSSRNEMIVKLENGVLTVRPLIARGEQPLRPAGADTFVLEERPDLQLTFLRSVSGEVSALRVGADGSGPGLPRLAPSRVLPGELLLQGKKLEAARALQRDEPEQAVAVAQSFARTFPSRIALGVACLGELARLRPRDPEAAAALAEALVMAGDRAGARREYTRCLELDESHFRARVALGMLDGRGVAAQGWQLPFTLDQLFRAPSPDELRSVTKDWASRDLRPHSVAVVARGTRPWGVGTARVSLVSHRVHGS